MLKIQKKAANSSLTIRKKNLHKSETLVQLGNETPERVDSREDPHQLVALMHQVVAGKIFNRYEKKDEDKRQTRVTEKLRRGNMTKPLERSA